MQHKGFTLVELLVVIAIVGILAVGLLVALNPLQQFKKARDSVRKQDLDTITKALATYRIAHGYFPGSDWANSSQAGFLQPLIDDHILNKIPQDPSGNTGCSGDPRDPICYAYFYYAGGWCFGGDPTNGSPGYILTGRMEADQSIANSQKVVGPCSDGSTTQWVETPGSTGTQGLFVRTNESD